MYKNNNIKNNNHYKKAGRPRLENSPLREYWRAAKRREKNLETKI